MPMSNLGPFHIKKKINHNHNNWLIHLVISFDVIFFSALPEDPEFTDVIENVTVPAGRNIKLACSVKNLGSYKVMPKNIHKHF